MTQAKKPSSPATRRIPKDPAFHTGKKAGSDSAAEAAKRLAKMTPDEQAAELFKTMVASSGKKSW